MERDSKVKELGYRFAEMEEGKWVKSSDLKLYDLIVWKPYDNTYILAMVVSLEPLKSVILDGQNKEGDYKAAGDGWNNGANYYEVIGNGLGCMYTPDEVADENEVLREENEKVKGDNTELKKDLEAYTKLKEALSQLLNDVAEHQMRKGPFGCGPCSPW